MVLVPFTFYRQPSLSIYIHIYIHTNTTYNSSHLEMTSLRRVFIRRGSTETDKKRRKQSALTVKQSSKSKHIHTHAQARVIVPGAIDNATQYCLLCFKFVCCFRLPQCCRPVIVVTKILPLTRKSYCLHTRRSSTCYLLCDRRRGCLAN